MSHWVNAAVCDACWQKHEPLRVPHRLKQPEMEVCRICRQVTKSGIYLRLEVPDDD